MILNIILAMSADRKKVKTEKLDLLHQMSQLYMSLEEKDKEIREYNKNYENLVQETHQKVKQVCYNNVLTKYNNTNIKFCFVQ